MDLKQFKTLEDKEKGKLIRQWLGLDDLGVYDEAIVSNPLVLYDLRKRMFNLGYSMLCAFQPKEYLGDHIKGTMWEQGEYNIIFHKGSTLDAQLEVISSATDYECIGAFAKTELEATILAIAEVMLRNNKWKKL